MTLSDLASLGSFVSALAVLVSLIFLYFQLRQLNQQVRQAEKNQQAAIRQTRATQTMDTVARGTEPSLAEALNKGLRGDEDISETAHRQFYQYARAAFFGWEDGFYQHADGLFTEAGFGSQRLSILFSLRHIGIRTQWRLQRQTFGREFVAWIDKLVAETPIGEPADLETWRNGLRDERSAAPY